MVLERKISDTLEDMGEILSRYYAPTHHLLYPLKRLEIPVSLINHRLRLSAFTGPDRDKLKNLYTTLNRYYDYYDTPPYQRYYVKLFLIKIAGILSK